MLTSHAALRLGHFSCGLGKENQIESPPQITHTLRQVPEPFHEMYLAISVDLQNKKRVITIQKIRIFFFISFRFKQMPTSTLKNVVLLLQCQLPAQVKGKTKGGGGGAFVHAFIIDCIIEILFLFPVLASSSKASNSKNLLSPDDLD